MANFKPIFYHLFTNFPDLGVLGACMLVHKTSLLAICEKVLKNQVEKVEKLYEISSNCQAVVAIPVLSISVHR